MLERARSMLLAVSERPGRLPAMDGLRALAVLLVFAVHFSGSYAFTVQGHKLLDTESVASSSGAFDLTLYWLFRSHHGVLLFFVISGFLIGRIVLFSRHFDYFTFLRNRFLRIYPALVTSLLIAIYFGVQVFQSIEFEWRTVLSNLALLNGAFPDRVPGYNPPTWSLWFEWVFYVTFPATLVYWRFGLGAHRAVFWCAALAIPGALLIFYQTLFILFFAGLAVALCPDERLRAVAKRVPDALAAGFYLSVTTAYCAGAIGYSTQVWLFALASAALITQACYGTGWLNRFFCLAPLRLLGSVSYSFYLLHFTIVLYVFMVVHRAGLVTPDSAHSVSFAILLALACFAPAFAAACILYAIAERPYFAGKGHAAPHASARARAAPE